MTESKLSEIEAENIVLRARIIELEETVRRQDQQIDAMMRSRVPTRQLDPDAKSPFDRPFGAR